MAGTACGADVLLISVAYKGVEFNLATGFDFNATAIRTTILQEAKIGPACRPKTGGDCVATVFFQQKPPFNVFDAAADTPGNLVITMKKGDGSTRTHTIRNLLPNGYASSFQSGMGNPPQQWRQEFVLQDLLESDPLTST